jgi:tetraacyldisaccharide 4'-kinase
MNFFENKWPALLLWPFSVFYNFITSLRNTGYSFGILKQHRLDIPVISIGNITVGGTGKTPTVIFIAKWLAQRGIKTCILSRGYGRKETGPVVVIGSEENNWNSCLTGDEPLLLARHLPDTPIIVDADRVRGGQLAQQRFQPDMILLDDGLQHRRLYRDIDIVTFRSISPFGNGFILPVGPLRESRRRLRKAHLFWFNGPKSTAAGFFPEIPVIRADYHPVDLLDDAGKTHSLPSDELAVVAFSGLANPAGFRHTLLSLAIKPKAFISYADHHAYNARDIAWLEEQREKEQVPFLLTTEKDWVKLAGRIPKNDHWRCLRIQLVPDNAEQTGQILSDILALTPPIDKKSTALGW